jgi:hypothetical protein
MPRRTLALLVLLSLASVPASALAQPLQVLPPPDRFVAPGEYVTLVYRMEAHEALEVELAAGSALGWTILRQPGVIALQPGRSTPVALTLGVPRGAPAAARDLVTLQGSAFEAVVALTVSERVELALEAPSELTLGDDGLRVTVRNEGNTTEDVRVTLRRGSETSGEQTRTLPPGAYEELRFALTGEGLHSVALSSASGSEVRRSVRVQRDAALAPAPFRVAARLAGGVNTSGAWNGVLALRGPLSDFARLDARIDPNAYRRSFAAVDLEHWSLRVGSGGRAPFGLDVPGDWGASGSYRADAWGVAAAFGWLGDDRFAALVAGMQRSSTAELAAAVGVRDGRALAALRAEFTGGDVDVLLSARYRDGAVSAAVTADLPGDEGDAQVTLEAQELLSAAARLRFAVRYRAGPTTLYGDLSAPLGANAEWGGRLGWNEDLLTPLPGSLRLALQAGLRESFARVTHRVLLGGGWRANSTIGVRIDVHGVGLTLTGAWDRLGASELRLDGSLAYYPGSGRLDGAARVRYALPLDPLDVALGGSWHLGDRALGASANLGWRGGAWQADLSAALRYAYASDVTRPWSASVSLGAAYAFEAEVPEGLTDASGGRRLGTLRGAVRVGDEALAGVVVEVGRARVTSDADGRFELCLPPGEYDARVDLRTLPIAYRLLEPGGARVRVELRGVHELTIEALRTAALQGRVLEDSAGDGVPDDPARGVEGRLLLTDADGLRRSVSTDAEGRFEVRGLPLGTAELRLVEVPRGASVVGDERLELVLSAAQPAEAMFLVRPVQAVARSFAPQTLRLRSIEVERDRLPPGAAPIVQVRVQGEPQLVWLESPAGVVDLRPDAELWIGRLPLPADAAPGVYAFRALARDAENEVSRGAQVVVDPGAPLVELGAEGPVRAGGILSVRASAYRGALGATLRHPFGAEIVLAEVTPGRWVGAIAVPSGAEDAVYEALVTFTFGDGRRLVESVRFRVLAP